MITDLQVFQILNFLDRDTTLLNNKLEEHIYTEKKGVGWLHHDLYNIKTLSLLENDFLMLRMKSMHICSGKPICVYIDLKDKWLLIDTGVRDDAIKVIAYIREVLFLRLKVMLPDSISAKDLIKIWSSDQKKLPNHIKFDKTQGHLKNATRGIPLVWKEKVRFLFTEDYSLLDISYKNDYMKANYSDNISMLLKNEFSPLLNGLFYINMPEKH